MCLQRGWEESHGPAPARREAEGELGAKLPYKGSRGRGGGAFLADPHWPRTRWSGERGRVISGRLHPCGCVKEETARKTADGGGAVSLHSVDIPGLRSTRPFPNIPDQTVLTVRARLNMTASRKEVQME